MKKTLFLFACLLMALTSCFRPEQVEFRGVSGLKIGALGASSVQATLRAEAANRSGANLVVKSAALHLFDRRDGRELARLDLREPVVLPRHSDGAVDLPLVLRLPGGVWSAVGLGRRIERQDPDLWVRGEARVRGGLMGKKFKIREMPLSTLLSGVEMEGLSGFSF